MFKKVKTSYRERDESLTLEILQQYALEKGVTRLADITNLDRIGMPVFVAVRPRAKSLSTSQGKGTDYLSAKCSALMESIELSYAEDVIPEIKNISCYDLNECAFVNPNMLSNAITYKNKKKKHHWVNGKTLLEDNNILIPFQHVSLDSSSEDVVLYGSCSTGLAGGNNYAEALLHSLLENIERSQTLKYYQVDGCHNPLIKQITKFCYVVFIYHENHYDIPCFEVKIKAKSPFDNQVVFSGKGCHLDKNIALNRAIVEAAQSRLTAISGIREDIDEHNYVFENSMENCTYPTLNFEVISSMEDNSIIFCINYIKSKLKKKNNNALVYIYHNEDICILKSSIIFQDDLYE